MLKSIHGLKIPLMATLCLAFVLVASSAFAEQYQWTIHFPKGLSGAQCHIHVQDARFNVKTAVLNEGDTLTWSTDSRLRLVYGSCDNYPGPKTGSDRLLTRACDGTDFDRTFMVATNISCAYDASFNICLKGNGDAGFCPQ
ncbi:MAG: hypothetical protein H0S85_05305 [Desulfovibrionaceae bacterium]|jgi:hypothetical protein|nr:hypothetical protein [Desulfovibrionaceae bacterium]